MRLLRSPVLPRVLLGIFGVLCVLLLLSSLESIRLGGLLADSVFMSAFSAALAGLCFWAAAGKTRIFTREPQAPRTGSNRH